MFTRMTNIRIALFLRFRFIVDAKQMRNIKVTNKSRPAILGNGKVFNCSN